MLTIKFTLKKNDYMLPRVSSVYDGKHSLIYIRLIYLPPQGYVSRQALYACATCDPETSAGVCLACCLECHEGHELFELYTKRFYYKILITYWSSIWYFENIICLLRTSLCERNVYLIAWKLQTILSFVHNEIKLLQIKFGFTLSYLSLNSCSDQHGYVGICNNFQFDIFQSAWILLNRSMKSKLIELIILK